MPKTYRIGSRGSLLALTQTQLIQRKLQEITGDNFEIIVIKTLGDQIVDKPLWQLDGKDFFTKELDLALINGEVDLVVHSYKDLAIERPEEIQLAAIPKREMANDILICSKNIIKNLKNTKQLVIGTSSPRRISTLKDIGSLLPAPLQEKELIPKVLRGNVNGRLEKLKRGEYDAIILAGAGLSRLALGEESKIELQKLWQDLIYMILPLSRFPTAAAQGALAIECQKNRQDQGQLWKKLQLLNDPRTQECVEVERKIFKSYGGGCHLAVGVHVMKSEAGVLEWHRGEKDEKKIDLSHFTPQKVRSRPCGPFFYGMPTEKVQDLAPDLVTDECLKKNKISFDLPKKGHFLVTSNYCLPKTEVSESWSGEKCFWASGIKTWQTLAQAGFWVYGGGENLGQKSIEYLSQSSLIELLSPMPWYTLTSQNALGPFLGPAIACYERLWQKPNEEFVQKLQKTHTFFWTSFFQFREYSSKFPFLLEPQRQHATGLGKTYDEFRKNGIEVMPFLSGQEFLDWIQGNE